MTAAVLAVLGGIAGAIGLLSLVTEYVRYPLWHGLDVLSALAVVKAGAQIGATVLLVAGAILLFLRRTSGPITVLLGCLATLGAYVLGSISLAIEAERYGYGVSEQLDRVLWHSSLNGLFEREKDGHWALSVLLLVFPIVTLILAASPSTRRWCSGPGRHGTWVGAPASGVPPYGPQPPAMPPPPGYAAPQGHRGQPVAPQQPPQSGYPPR